MTRTKRNRLVRRTGLALLVLTLAFGIAEASGTLASAIGITKSSPRQSVQKLVAGRVMTIGSSVAQGWADKVGGGYLKRAFVSYSAYSKHMYTVVSRAVPGDGATQINGKYHLWLADVKPQIVVMSWGGLDDAHDKTPLDVFRATIHHQIALALQNHEIIMVVTPPVTRASYTEYPTIEPMYLDAEMAVARSFHSSDVFVFDVFDQMKEYIVQHHTTYIPYMADGWHPNTLGHELAGELLFNDMKAAFAKGPIPK